MLSKLANLIPPRAVAILVTLFSALALGAGFTAQFGFGLKPCELCLIQRIPFAINILLGIVGTIWLARTRMIIVLSGLVYLVNSGIAFFHSGVERHWWTSFSGCSTPDLSGSIEDLMARIEKTDVTRCDDIPWQLFGLSMANYNVMMCAGLGMACLLYLVLRKEKV
ncbi:MAG TPA: disulfide bond formation protein B [Alphaproteobacteria bacterium]|nr:disulfide bond formation protein B [Alphaproteobacteria bacterium]HNS44162.1 disulfide bond formation protein B [Alphaproteobacteria bacterium]